MKHIRIQRLNWDDVKLFEELIHVFERVFEMENVKIPRKSHLLQLLERDDFNVFVALLDGRVLGGLSSYLLQQYYTERPLAYIYDLAVEPAYQRQGIGKQLILEARNFYTQVGVEDLFVQAERVDEHAVAFYRSTSPSQEEDVVYFSYTLNP